MRKYSVYDFLGYFPAVKFPESGKGLLNIHSGYVLSEGIESGKRIIYAVFRPFQCAELTRGYYHRAVVAAFGFAA